MAKENKARYVILGLLAHAPMTGYDIKKKIENSISHFYEISYGQIYPELARLEEQGFVSLTVGYGESGMVRKVYSLTAAGLVDLQAWIAKAVEEEKLHYDILLKLFFGRHVSMQENIEQIKAFRERSAAKLELFQSYEEELRRILGASMDHAYVLLTVRFGQKACQAYLEWADEAICYLQDNNNDIERDDADEQATD